MDDHDSDTSLWDMLGISPQDATPPLDDNVWDTVLHAALDPSAPEADDSIVPVHDDQASAVDTTWTDDAAAGADHHTGDDHDLGGLLHDLGWDSHDLGPLDHDHDPGHHDLGHPDGGHPDLGGNFGDDHGHDGHPDLGGGFEHLGG